MTIQDRQQAINNYLSVNGRALFEELLDNDSHPIVAAVTFMALLEMIKTDEVVFRQSELFGPIWIYRKKNNPDYADEMARETVFYSKDPDVKPGLVEEIRNMALARSQAGSVGDIAAVMKEAVLWTTRGRNVTEEDLQAMLEGREDLSEVQDNPFAEMMKEDEAAEAAMSGALAGSSAPANESAPTESVSQAVDAAAPEENVAQDVPPAEEAVAPMESASPAESASPVEESVSPVESLSQVENAAGTDKVIEDTKPADTSKMSDEEFEAFMKKAQAFYDTQAKSSDNEDSPAEDATPEDDDEFPSLEVHSSNE